MDTCMAAKNQKSRCAIVASFILAGFVLAVIAPFVLASDNDVFWHIKNGQWIIDNCRIPTKDAFSWYGTAHDFRYISQEWLYGVLVFFAYSLAGFAGVRVFTVLLSMLTHYLIYKVCLIRTGRRGLSAATAFFATLGAMAFFMPRPQIVSYVLVLLFMICMEKKRRLPGALVIIFGVNVHGGIYPIYLILAAYYLFQEVRVKKYILYMALYCLAVLANPYTYELYLYTIKAVTFSDTMAYISEWASPALLAYPPLVCILFGLPALTRKSKVRVKDLLLAVALMCLAFKSIRHIIFVYIVVLPIFSAYFHETLQWYAGSMHERALSNEWAKALVGSCRKLKNSLLRCGSLMLVLALACLGGAFACLAVHNPPLAALMPAGAVEYIKEHEEIDRLFNDYDVGGFLILNDIAPLIDSRQDLYTPNINNTNLFSEYMSVLALKEDYEPFLEKYRINYLLLAKNKPIVSFLAADSRYKTVYEDDGFIIFERINKIS